MSYGADNIQVKDFRSACRSLVGMYLGADGTDATFNAFLEILNNACDEAIMGRGDKIIIDLKDNEITLTDFGAGVPRGANKDCDEVLIEIYTKAHSSGKYNSDAYSCVRGQFGCGSSAVCVCSKEFDVYTKRDGAKWHLLFKDGIPQSDKAQLIEKTKETGTSVRFIPDKTIFHIAEEEPAFDYKRIRDELEITSYFIPNVSFILKYNNKIETFLSKNGLKDFAATQIKNPLHKNYVYGKHTFDGNTTIEVFAQWTNGKEKGFVFSNGALNPGGGTPITGAKTAFSRTINSLTGKTFDSDMIRKGLVYIINVKLPKPIYQNQVKDKIQNAELKGYTQTTFTEAIKEFASKCSEDFNKIVGLLDKQQKAERAAERARDAILNHEKEAVAATKKKIVSTNKLRDAKKLGQDSILLAVEGLSAGGSMSIGRDPSKYGIFLMRGKGINCYTNSIEDVLANEEIKILLQALGIVYGKVYNPSKLRYGKLAIASDADADGANIGLLLMVALQVLCPQFIQEGRLYWLKSPLYIVDKNGKREYYYTEEEFRNRKENGGIIIRVKGLGQLAERDLKDSMFNPQWQHLEQLVPDEESIETLEQLMGDDVKPRKEFVTNNIDFGEFVYG